MSEQQQQFKYLMEDRELAIQAAQFQSPWEDSERRRQQEIVRVFAEAASTSHDGLDPAEVFGEEGGAVCAAFTDRMAIEDFPASQLLENASVSNSIVSHFWRRLIGHIPSEPPYKIRGYKVGEIGGETAMDAYLCEDGKVRAHTSFFKAAIDRYEDQRCLVRDIPIDLVTHKRKPVVPVTTHNGGVVSGLEAVLLGYIGR